MNKQWMSININRLVKSDYITMMHQTAAKYVTSMVDLLRLGLHSFLGELNVVRLFIINKTHAQSPLATMFTLSQSKQATTTTKQPIKKQNRRKALPLPILSLQTKSELNPETCPKQKAKPTKPPIRENFKKMLDILNKPDRKNQCLPNNYYNKINHSKDLLRKRMRTNLDCGPSKLDNLLLRAEIFNAMKMMEGSDKPKSEEDAESSSLRASTNNLQRTIRFRKKSKPSLQTHSNRFMKWESFCTSISYQNKNPQCLPNLNLSKKLSHRTYIIKKRSESTLTHKNVVEDINGWEDAPVRYATDYDRLDFSEVYD